MGSLYEQDFIGWTEQQSRALRDLSHSSNAPLDWENLVEEVEGLGRSHSDAVARQIRRVVLHLLKLEFSPATLPRAGWRETVREARAEIEGRLESDPGLKPRLPEMIRRESPRATRLAAQALLDYGEHAAATSARARSHYTDEQILGSWLPGDGSAG